MDIKLELCAAPHSNRVCYVDRLAGLQELGKGRARKLWDWGKGLYRVSAVTYSAFSLYTNPWLVRAVLAALWTASKVMTGLVH